MVGMDRMIEAKKSPAGWVARGAFKKCCKGLKTLQRESSASFQVRSTRRGYPSRSTTLRHEAASRRRGCRITVSATAGTRQEIEVAAGGAAGVVSESERTGGRIRERRRAREDRQGRGVLACNAAVGVDENGQATRRFRRVTNVPGALVGRWRQGQRRRRIIRRQAQLRQQCRGCNGVQACAVAHDRLVLIARIDQAAALYEHFCGGQWRCLRRRVVERQRTGISQGCNGVRAGADGGAVTR